MAELKSADIQLIQRILPHRYPFLLVDKVVEIDGYASAVGIKNVTMNEPHFQGHFPGTPIMPGVTIIEAMAQTAGVMLGVGFDVVDTDLLIYFMSIDKCKFRRKVVPGDIMKMEVTTVRGKPGGKIFKFDGKATVDGEIAAQAEFSAFVDWDKEKAGNDA
ncbi:MAG: 3-hydroxyacyl-ACP dehydratase FabZ [Marinibacterium sp.]|nr:3-hydroxyacyl-ACP dehydratase FabZ [Marinibacterium sp.]